MQEPVNKIMSNKEAAEYLHIKPQTLTDWVMRGCSPPYSRIGQGRGKILYLKSRVDEWLLEQETKAKKVKK